MRVLLAFALAIAASFATAADFADNVDEVFATDAQAFGPVESAPIDQSKWALLSPLRSPGSFVPADSGWFAETINGVQGFNKQCNITVDRIGNIMGCLERVSVMCILDGFGSVRGVGRYNQPFAPPLLLALYTPPSIAPVGYIELWHLGDGASIGANGPPGDWRRAARTTGEDSCAFNAK